MEKEKTGERSELRRLAEFIHNLTWEALPEQVRKTVPLRVLDLVSVAAGAVHDPLVEQAQKSLAWLYGGGALWNAQVSESEEKGKSGGEKGADTGTARIWGSAGFYPPVLAAMVNAMLAHTLELDDVHTASKTHGSASLIPAAWACAQALGRSGKEFLLAVVCGYETVNRVGMAFGVSSHRNRGWHATATCGVFGCAAACAKLLNLDVDQIVSALGMAGTQSSGVWAFLGDGCNCKILHTARAAADGMEAAFLAKCKMTGPEHIFDAKDGGLLTAMSDGGDITKISEGLGRVYEILNMDMKPYPCCRSAHCAIDAALELRKDILGRTKEKQNLLEELSEAIEAIEIETYLVGYKQCAVSDGCRNPNTTLDAKFSTPYSTAVALLFGTVSMKEFEPDIVKNQAVQTLLHKVTVTPSERFTSCYPKHWGCFMRVTMKDETRYETEVQDPSGSVARPLTREQAIAKAGGFLAKICSDKTENKIYEILNLEEMERLPEI